MARILSRDRDKDSFNDDEAERRFLQSKPVCFIIFGKPGCGKTTLAKKLAKTWKCEFINGKDPLMQAMELSTELGVKAQTILSRGEALPEELASQLLHDKIDSPEVTHHGYVLDGFPSLCEDWLSMKEQLELIKNWKYKPDFIINLKIPDRDLENRRVNQRIDSETGKIYTKDMYDPSPSKIVEDIETKEENEDGDEEQGDEDDFSEVDTEDDDDDEEGSKIQNYNDDEEDEGFPGDILARLVVRPEDLPENATASIQRYKNLLLRMLEDFMADHDQQKLIEVDANLPAKAVFKAVMTKLNTFGLNRALTTLRLQGEDSEEISNDADEDDMLRSLAGAEMIAPRFRWRRSRWARLCPVELYTGNIVNGLPQFAVSFLDKIYCLSSSEALAKFIRNPRQYITEPYPCPPCKICVLGPPCSGKTTLAKNLAQRYQAQYVDIELLIGGTKQEAKRKLLEEIREEAVEAAIAKVIVQIQLQKEEEEERLAEAARLAAEAAEKDEEDEDEEPNDAGNDEQENGGGEVNENEVEENEVNETKVEKDDEVVKEETEVKEEIVVDENHPEVRKMVSAAMKEAEHREADISADEYVDVVEEAIQARLKEVDEAKAKGQRLGGYVLDNFPFTREQFTLLIERALIPDSVIYLKDDSEHGSYLAKRWSDLRRAEKYLPDIQEIDDRIEEGDEIEKDELSKEPRKETDSGAEPGKTTSVAKKPTDTDLEEYQVLRSTFDNNWQQLQAIIKGTNNLEPIIIHCDHDINGITEDAIKAIEDAFIYHPWEYTGMDEDEEEEDAEEDEEIDEEEENDVFNKDLGKKQFGDTKHFCPVMLKEKGVLWPGMAECAAKYRERVYFFSSVECRRQFLDDPTQFLPADRPLKPPPIRLFIIGPKGCGKTMHGRYLAEKLGVFHIDFKERLQELIISKTKKRVGPDYEDEEEENPIEEGENNEDKEGDEKQEEENKEEDDDLNLTEEEENIYVSLTEGEHLQRDTVENILSPWWNEEPYRSRGFVLEGFPRNDDESRVLSMTGLFPDAAILLGVEDTDIIDRLLPGKLASWKVKRDKRMAVKAKLKAIASKKKEEARAKRKSELLLEMAERKAEKKARMEENGDEGDDDDDDDDEEMDEADVEAILDGEFEDDEDLDEEEEETEEDAVDRLRVEITDRFDEDNSRLGTVQDSLEEILVPRVEIDASRKPRIVRYCMDEALKPIVDFREALFSRCYSVSPGLAHRMLVRGYKFPSRFGKWCPVKLLEGDVIQPYYPRGTMNYPVIYRQHIYYLSSEKAKSDFISCPMKYLKQPSPKPMVTIQMAIIGPPKSGKTTLANRFVAEYGVVRLSIGEVIRRLLTTQPNTDLVRQINHHLKTGCTVPDDLAVQALDVVLMDQQCQVRGFILDGFPTTKHQIDLMTEKCIIPVNVVELCVNDDDVFRRATQDRRSPSRTYPVHDSHTIISIRLACWKREIEAVRAWYQNVQRNLIQIDGTGSKWLVWKTAFDQAKRNIQDIQGYLVRLAEGQAASIANMCVTPKEFAERLGDYGEYCPVSFIDYGHLVDCSGNPTLDFAAEFRGRYYKMDTAKELEMFLENPSAYVPPLAPRALPPPDMLPKRRTASEMKTRFPCQIELQGYCPVTYLDGKKRYEFIVPGDPDLVVEYRGSFYTFQSEKKLDTFMRTPEMYHGLTLPRKLPPRSTPLAIHQLPMLGFLEQTASEAITKALTSVGCFKPKYPFLTARRSALLYVAYHLKAFNPKSSEYVRTKYKKKLEKFEERCKLITYLGRNMSNRYREPFQRPFDFDVKMKNFLELKVLRPTAQDV